MPYEDNAHDRFMQEVKDGNLKTFAHERAFRRKLKLSDDDPLPPYADRGPTIVLDNYEPQCRK